jgi:hypothetical protein
MPQKSEKTTKADAAKDLASKDPASKDQPSDDLAATVARVRWLMIISALTTAIAIAAVAGVVGYRFFNRGNGAASTIVNGAVFLPKGAHVDSTTISDGRIVVTFDIGGATAVRFFDLKTLQLIGELRFGTEH